MLYQKMLIGSKPYFLSVGRIRDGFEVHRHPEIEISYCLEGGYQVLCENKLYTLSAGDFLLVPPMAAHELPPNPHDGKSVTIEIGYAFLGDYFESFTDRLACPRFYSSQAAVHAQLDDCFREIAALHASDASFAPLSVKGNLYKLSDLLLQLLHADSTAVSITVNTADIKKIDQALKIIYDRYFTPLTVESVSAACGYSKSNFCRIFKDITGNTFHSTLNRHRIEIACILLRETRDPIEKIAQETGFTDAKSFCRVFKAHMGINAAAFRKSLPVHAKK